MTRTFCPIRVLVFTASLLLVGCASYSEIPAGTVKEIVVSPVLERQVVDVPPRAVEEAPPPQYLVGPGDVLFVNVSGRPELSSPVANGGKVQGSRVDGSGNIHLPLVGSVQVAGFSMEQIRDKLEQSFTPYLVEPWVVVEVAEYKSQPIYLLGQFRAAGTYYMERPMNLLQGLALGSGLLENANLRSARLIRDNRAQPIDIFGLVESGSTAQNIWLKPGDSIYVPNKESQNVFVFGAVKKPGLVVMPSDRLNLLQALASAGLGEVGSNWEHIRIIRSLSATRGELLIVDLEKILRGQALPFPLVDGDIIYAPRSRIGNWNQAIEELLPSLQAISSILQPFVQIHVLTRD